MELAVPRRTTDLLALPSIKTGLSTLAYGQGPGLFGLMQFGVGGVVLPLGGGEPIGGGGPPCATSKLRIDPPVEYFTSPLWVIQAIWLAFVRLAVFP